MPFVRLSCDRIFKKHTFNYVYNSESIVAILPPHTILIYCMFSANRQTFIANNFGTMLLLYLRNHNLSLTLLHRYFTPIILLTMMSITSYFMVTPCLPKIVDVRLNSRVLIPKTVGALIHVYAIYGMSEIYEMY